MPMHSNSLDGITVVNTSTELLAELLTGELRGGGRARGIKRGQSIRLARARETAGFHPWTAALLHHSKTRGSHHLDRLGRQRG